MRSCAAKLTLSLRYGGIIALSKRPGATERCSQALRETCFDGKVRHETRLSAVFRDVNRRFSQLDRSTGGMSYRCSVV
jgi:hypothetical protein